MNIRHFIPTLLVAAALPGMFSCEDAIKIERDVDSGSYQSIYEHKPVLKDEATNSSSSVLEFFRQSEITPSVKVELSQAYPTAFTGKVAFDAAYLTEYNAANKTDYVLYPASLVTFSDEGAVTIPANRKSSNAVLVTIAVDEAMQEGITYAVPVAFTAAGSASRAGDDVLGHCVYLIKSMRSAPDCFKGEELPKGFVFIETGECNPLNVLSFQLENGKYLWDVVSLFSANINMDRSTGRPYLSLNQSTQDILDNRELYLKPLQDRGIKVNLCLLGNHDEAGLAQLSESGAKDFAKQVALAVERYGLDGVCLDDEYSTSPDLNNPALAAHNSANGARLVYELKKLMPDKDVVLFEWGSFYARSMPAVDGVPVSEYVDYVVANYGSSGGMSDNKKNTYASMEFARRYTTFSASMGNAMLTQGYGWFMGFAMAPTRFVGACGQLRGGVEVLYGSALKDPEVFYFKGDPTPYVYPDQYADKYPNDARN